ncbi:MAG TPA: hypothetical protein VKZ53_17990 [Candidatus Angelobacter sp.]|nr:hypothetical protein [Candidatus Angelobacter sp.]
MTRIGITGHQELDSKDAWTWVTRVMLNELAEIMPPIIAVTSLAIGADQLLARLVLKKGGTIHAILPYANIERSFSPENLDSFRDLVSHATVEILNNPGGDENSYLAAGQRVADISDLMFAVWNGKPAKGKGGTADIVAYALSLHKPLIHINPITQIVRHL